MSANVLIAGDFCPQYRVAELFKRGEFATVLGNVRDEINLADYSIINFECPLANETDKKYLKSGPNLCCDISGVAAIKWAGFDCVTLANNHFLDYGEHGARNTLEACRGIGLDYVGGGMNLADVSKVFYKVINGLRVAIINCCENEFSIATENRAGSCPLNPVKQYYQIKEARENADSVLVIIHGGSEFYQLPTPRMQDTYRFFIDAGANAVINHHQHCYSGYEIYNNCPIFYGLGNFCFDRKGKRDDNWNKGYMVKLIFGKDNKTEFEILPYEQCNNNPVVSFVDYQQEIDKIEFINDIILKRDVLENKFMSFVEDNKEQYLLALEPYVGHWGGLRKRKFLPSLLSKEFFLRIFGYLKCESHTDRLILILKNIIYNG